MKKRLLTVGTTGEVAEMIPILVRETEVTKTRPRMRCTYAITKEV